MLFVIVRDCTRPAIVIPQSVSSIGPGAFRYCSRLTTANLPDALTVIEDYTFEYCSSLTALAIPNTVTMIGKFAISHCYNLFEISFPNNLTSFGKGALQHTSRLTTVGIPDSVTSIGRSVFRNCTRLQSVFFSSNAKVTVISDYLFSRCSSLQSVSVPTGVTSIGNYSFEGCFNLQTINIPENVTEIGEGAFEGCSRLIAIDIPSGVEVIGQSTFESCVRLETVVIPNTVRRIEPYAFRTCSSLASITIPNSVETVATAAFPACLGYGLSISDGINVNPTGDHDVRCLPCFNKSTLNISNTVTHIGPFSFRMCLSVTSLTIPDTVTQIGLGAFEQCESLTAVTIPESVTIIGPWAFLQCFGLSTISIPLHVDLGEFLYDFGGSVFESVGCNSSMFVPGAMICNCSPCLTVSTLDPTSIASPTSATTFTASVRPLDALNHNNSNKANGPLVIIVSVLVSFVVVVLLIIIITMIVVRRRSQNERTLGNIRRIAIEHEMLAQAKDTFYNYYGPTFKDEISETTFEKRFGDTVVIHTTCFSQLREIARGNGGIIHKAKYRGPNDAQVVDVAIKSCNVIDVAANHRLLVEARLMLLMKHPAIIPLLGIHLFKTTRPWMVTSFMVNGDLKIYLRGIRQSQLNAIRTDGKNAFTARSAVEVATKLAGALSYLNRIGVIHGDIAARNVLCGSPATNVMLSDFGNAIPTRLAKQGNLGDRYSAAGPAVPFRWMAPEALLESILSHESDVWSFGVLLWEIDCYGKTPFGLLGYDDVKQELFKGGRLPKSTTGFRGLYDMATQCWCSRASERVTAHNLHQQFTRLLGEIGNEKADTGATRVDSSYLTVGVCDNDEVA